MKELLPLDFVNEFERRVSEASNGNCTLDYKFEDGCLSGIVYMYVKSLDGDRCRVHFCAIDGISYPLAIRFSFSDYRVEFTNSDDLEDKFNFLFEEKCFLGASVRCYADASRLPIRGDNTKKLYMASDNYELLKNELENYIALYSSSYRKHTLKGVTCKIHQTNSNKVVVRLEWGISFCLGSIDLTSEKEVANSKKLIKRLFWNLVDMVIEKKNKEVSLSALPSS